MHIPTHGSLCRRCVSVDGNCSYVQNSSLNGQSPHWVANSIFPRIIGLEGMVKKINLTGGKSEQFLIEMDGLGAVLGAS